ncbi:response regulator transcription factor [Kitasatospora herbaricolor]|uniref:Response regulator transcription factor n=1 Tax=Kitasatospora herbaricolor TaxID=68217 RepID=A0ABZ1WDD5_9ACTN|nr:response regulator transcription factor [Kitasatospora herbaricolor]
MIRVVVAEDLHMIRGALVALLELEQDLRVVADVGCDDAMAAALEHHPEVAVIAVGEPRSQGISTAVRLKEELPSCKTLILTNLYHPAVAREALAAQVGGYLLKDAPPMELARAVRRVAAGQRVVDPHLARVARDRRCPALTPREIDVLRLAADGAEIAEIAARVHLSVGTIRNYLTSTVTKLNARNRLDAVRIAREAGWLI